MPEVVRNAFRRKVRTSLTILGITIGVFALTVMGGMAEHFNLSMKDLFKFFGTRIIIRDAKALGPFSFRQPLPLCLEGELEGVEGVKAAIPSVGVPMEEELGFVQFEMPPWISGVHPKSLQHEAELFPTLRVGRLLTAEDRGKAVIGANIAQRFQATVGDSIEVRGRQFQVVGIFERTLVSWDNFVFISFPEAQELYQETLPSIFQDLPIEVVGSFEVLPESGVDMNELAGRIEAQVKGIKTFPPEKLMGQAKQAQALFNAFLLGSGVITLIVGGLAVINTMTMSVHERVREIGLKKAVGASSTQILGEYLLEAAFIGLVGGVLGILLGSLTASAINSVTQAQGVTVFTMSPRLLIGSVAFAVGLAVVASFYPAYLAARLNPVQALRME